MIMSLKYVNGHFCEQAKPYVDLMSGHRFAGSTFSASGITSSDVPHSATLAAPAASIISSGV